ncbi:MAG: hypothetical protein JSV91_10400 [Phycisphaerales bacterium]|nr:MAG: hypothetical protein JSV91_10400 [Phycisphaerales bacterium]
MKSPSPNGPNGRDDQGRFAKGNPGGPGNPHGEHVGKLRAALLAAVTDRDMQAIAARLVQMAKDGDIQAVRELLNRTIGKPQEPDLLERIERLEKMLAERTEVWQ